MEDHKKADTGTQYDDAKNDSTQTVPDAEATTELLELANMFLHSCYWFLMLSTTLTRLDLSGLAWAAKQKDMVCREAAMTILSWIMKSGGRVELADISRPRMRENMTAEYAVRKWDQVDRWLGRETENMLEKVVVINFRMQEMLRNCMMYTINNGNLMGQRAQRQ